ncbi:MAG: hypothetical protein V8T45_01225 [Oscillospiraceae bacterium]
MGRYDSSLLDQLEFGPELSTDEIVDRSRELLNRWFQISAELRKKERRLKPSLLGRKSGRQKGTAATNVSVQALPTTRKMPMAEKTPAAKGKNMNCVPSSVPVSCGNSWNPNSANPYTAKTECRR